MDDDGAGGPGTRQRSRGPGGVLAAAVALVLVFLAVRLTSSSSPPDDHDRADPAPRTTDAIGLFDAATRGTLARQTAWISGLAALPALDVLPPQRHVALATDAPTERIALVLGRSGRDVYTAWLTGPAGAPPEQMALAAPPSATGGRPVPALWDVPELAWTPGLLVVLAEPGDQVSFATGSTIDADGHPGQQSNALPVIDGVVTAAVDAPVGEGGGVVTVRRSGSSTGFSPPLSDRARQVAEAPVEVADPRGLRASVDEAQLQAVLHEMAGAYGLAPPIISPVLLAAGPVGDSGERAVLVGATMPTGATVAWIGVTGSGSGDPATRIEPTPPAAAGAALRDRVLAVPLGWAVSRLPLPRAESPPGWLVISGPRGGTAAQLLGPGDDRIGTLPLVDGAGIGPVPPATTAVRVVGADGTELGRAPVAELPG